MKPGHNICEHGDHPAPDGQRFCSESCADCEGTDFITGDCAGLCFPLRWFEEREIHEARDYSLAGGQSLHCHYQLGSNPPACFRRDVNAGKAIGHLFDQDRVRLEATARKFGVRVIVVERIGKPLQHIDLCGAPMAKAMSKAIPRGYKG